MFVNLSTEYLFLNNKPNLMDGSRMSIFHERIKGLTFENKHFLKLQKSLDPSFPHSSF